MLTTIRELSDLTGLSPLEIRGGMVEAQTDDPYLGAGYAMAAGLAVAIKGDRHQWNLRRAHADADRLRERHECPACNEQAGLHYNTVGGTQRSGEFVSVDIYRCLACNHEWSD